MADRYWRGLSTDIWNSTPGTKWAATAGGATGVSVPTAADEVYFDATSQSCTLSTGAVCRKLDFTSFTAGRTLTHPASTALTIGDATAGTGNIALKFVSGMNYTLGNTTTSTISFSSSSATQQTVDFAGKANGNITYGGPGNYLLTSSMTMVTGTQITLFSGTLDTNNLNHQWGQFLSSNTNVRTLTLGSSTISMMGTGFDCTTSTNMTLNAGTSMVQWITVTTVTPSIAIPNLALYDVLITKSSGGSNINGTGTCTFRNFTMDNTVLGGGNRAIVIGATAVSISGVFKYYGATATNSGALASSNPSSTRTFSLGATGSMDLNSVDIRDIAATGTSTPVSGTRLGNAGGNSGFTFTAPKTMYWVGPVGAGTESWNFTNRWSLTSGGAAAGEIPLVHDNAVFDANSFPVVGQVVSMGNLRSCGFDASTATNNPTFRFINPSGGGNGHYGGMVFPTAGSTIDAVGAAGGSATISFWGRGNHNISLNGANIGMNLAIAVEGPGSMHTLQSNLTMLDSTRTFLLARGGFDANGYNMTVSNLNSNNGNPRSLNMGSGTWTLTGTGTVFNLFNATNFTMIDSDDATVVISDTSATAKGLNFNVYTYGKLELTAGGGGVVDISNHNPVFKHLKIGAGRTFTLAPAATPRISVLQSVEILGTAGNLVTIKSNTPGSVARISKPSGLVSGDYLNIQDMTAQGGAAWYAGVNSVNAGNNSGWIFAAPILLAAIVEGDSNTAASASARLGFAGTTSGDSDLTGAARLRASIAGNASGDSETLGAVLKRLVVSGNSSGDSSSQATQLRLFQALAAIASGDANASATPLRMRQRFSGDASGDSDIASALRMKAKAQGITIGDASINAMLNYKMPFAGLAVGDAETDVLLHIKLLPYDNEQGVYSPAGRANGAITAADRADEIGVFDTV